MTSSYYYRLFLKLLILFFLSLPYFANADPIYKTALGTPWQAGGTGTFEITTTSPWNLAGLSIIVKDVISNPPFSLSASQPNNAPWVCNDPNSQLLNYGQLYSPNIYPPIPANWFVCMLDPSLPPYPLNTGDPLPPIHVNVDIAANTPSGSFQNCAHIGHSTPAFPFWYAQPGCTYIPIQNTQEPFTLEKTAVGTPWQAGGTGSYQITVTNTGGTINSGALVLQDNGNFPSPPLNLTSMTGDNNYWSCSAGQCNYIGAYPIPAGTSWSFTVHVDIDANYTGGSVQNCAELTMQQQVSATGCADAVIDPISTPPPSFQLAKTAVGTPWQAGGTGSYQITVTNTGGIINSGPLVLQDNGNFPSPPLNLTSMTGDNNYWSCSAGQCSYIGAYPIPAGTSWSFTVHVDIDANYTGGSVQNCAEIAILQQTGPPMPQATGCADAVITPVPTPPSFTITKTALGTPWQVGGTGSYQITVTNTGGIINSGALVVQDNGSFPSPPLNLTSMTGDSNWSCSAGQCSYIGAYPIPAGASWSFTVNVDIDANYAGGSVQNCAELTMQEQASMPPVSQATGCADAVISLSPRPSFQLAKTAVGTPWQAGGTGSYQITVTNTGGIINSGALVLQDNGNFPSPPLNLTSMTGDSNYWYCSAGQCSYIGAYPIPAGASWSFTINVDIDANYTGGSVQNCAALSMQQGGLSIYQTTGCADAVIDPISTLPPSFQLEKTAVGTPWQVGGTGSYQITVTNTGGIIYSGALVVQDNGSFPSPPLNLTSIIGDNNWDCSTGQCLYTGVYPIPAGTSWSFTVNVDIDANYTGGSVQNCAELTMQQAGPPIPQATGCADAAITPLPSISRICGHKFQDKVTNPLSNWIITATNSNSSQSFSATTNAQGEYCMDVPPGTYTVNEQIPTISPPWSWVVLSPASGSYPTVVVAANTTVNGIDFINTKTQLGQICGQKLDTEGSPLSGWTFQATDSSGASYTSSPSDGDGRYCITQLPFNTYIISEQIQLQTPPTGWYWAAINPQSGSQQVQVNGTVNHIDFINQLRKKITSQHVKITMRHSPSKFSTGEPGTVIIKINNKGDKLKKGELSLKTHLPVGFSVKEGQFKAGKWICHGSHITEQGQDINCEYTRSLNKGRRAHLNFNIKLMKKEIFPKDTTTHKICSTASLAGRDSVVSCENVSVRLSKANSFINIPIGIGLGIIGGSLGIGGGQGSATGVK